MAGAGAGRRSSGAAAGSSRPGGGGWRTRPWSPARRRVVAEHARRESKRGPEIRLTLPQGEEVYRVAGARQAERVVAGGGVRAVESSDATGERKGKAGRAGRGLTFTAALRCFRVRFPQGCALADALTVAATTADGVSQSGCSARRAATATTVLLRRRWRGQEGAWKLEPWTGACCGRGAHTYDFGEESVTTGRG